MPNSDKDENESPNKNSNDESSFKIEDEDDLIYDSAKQGMNNYIPYQEVMDGDDEEEKK